MTPALYLVAALLTVAVACLVCGLLACRWPGGEPWL